MFEKATSVTDDVAEVIKARLRQVNAELEALEPLEVERERLERALHELTGEGAAPRPAGGPGHRRRGATHGPAGKRAPRGSNVQAILDYVAAHPGTTTPEIARATGIDRAVLYSAASRLTSAGRLRKQQLPDGQVAYEVVAE
ncbi:MAG TPA: hypothetical protein VN238_11150 [Solirubrobacteraceae bacterium]|nr:hypothetical protein [Solirubrobacteraceae bacterium]